MTQTVIKAMVVGEFIPLLSQGAASTCQVTGEHTCVVLRPLRSPEVEGTAWLAPFYRDFRLRFMSLLPGAFRCNGSHQEESEGKVQA